MVPRKGRMGYPWTSVELEVEKKLGLDGKEQIEQYGLEPFIEECKESVWKYKKMWEDFSAQVGFWPIWSILMLRTTTTISSRSGGR